MEYHNNVYVTDVFGSDTLKRVFSNLDNKCFGMEQTIREQERIISDLNKEISANTHKQLQSGYAMIGNVLKACIGTGDINEMGPGAAIVLDRIRDMQTIEEVHEYVNKLFTESAKQQ